MSFAANSTYQKIIDIIFYHMNIKPILINNFAIFPLKISESQTFYIDFRENRKSTLPWNGFKKVNSAYWELVVRHERDVNIRIHFTWSTYQSQFFLATEYVLIFFCQHLSFCCICKPDWSSFNAFSPVRWDHLKFILTHLKHHLKLTCRNQPCVYWLVSILREHSYKWFKPG